MKTCRFHFYLLFSLLAASGLLPAQNKGWHFWHLTEADGLFSQLGTSVVEDKKNGYLWFGSKYAVQRFDGEEFVQIYPKKGEKRLPMLTAWQTEVLLFDSKGWLWLNLNEQPCCYNPETGELIFSGNNPDRNPLFPDAVGWKVIEDSEYKIWITQQSGRVTIYDPV